MTHQASELIKLFNNLFSEQYNTKLLAGSNEPFYKVRAKLYHFDRIYYANDFFSSALHEIAHWCLAGRERRKQDDYAYWYEPDGRDQFRQNQFYQVECKPQALEWIFSVASNYAFQFSLDNLDDSIVGADEFKVTVQQQVGDYLVNGLPKRAEQFVLRLNQFYQSEMPIQKQFKIVQDYSQC